MTYICGNVHLYSIFDSFLQCFLSNLHLQSYETHFNNDLDSFLPVIIFNTFTVASVILLGIHADVPTLLVSQNQVKQNQCYKQWMKNHIVLRIIITKVIFAQQVYQIIYLVFIFFLKMKGSCYVPFSCKVFCNIFRQILLLINY